MKTLIIAALLATAIATPSLAQQAAVTTQMAEQLVYRTQMIRDRIGIQCNRVLSGHKRDQCETGVYTTYYGIVDTIRKAERISGGDSSGTDPLKLITQKMDEFDAKTAPDFKILEASQKW